MKRSVREWRKIPSEPPSPPLPKKIFYLLSRVYDITVAGDHARSPVRLYISVISAYGKDTGRSADLAGSLDCFL